jgi:uncharacterized membrane protein
MLPDSLLDLGFWAAAIELVGGLIITGYVVAALWVVARRRGPVRARLLVAEGVIAGLSFKLAGTLLKTILIQSWEQLALFVAIFVLRFVLKRFFMWDLAQVRRSERTG